MRRLGTMRVNDMGNLESAAVMLSLWQEIWNPLYVMDQATIEETVERIARHLHIQKYKQK